MRASKRSPAPLGPMGGYWRVVIAGVLLAGTVVLHGASGTSGEGAARTAFTLAFLGFGPGLAIMGILRLDDRVLEIAIALALSLSLETLLATGMTMLHRWDPTGGLVAMGGLTVVAGAVQVVLVRRVKRRVNAPPEPAEAL